MMSVTALIFLMSASFGQTDAEPDSLPVEVQIETIAYSADSVVFTPDDRDLTLVGAATVDYYDMSLGADTIYYSAEEETVTATGKPRLTDRSETITGTMMIYDLLSRQGRIVGADSKYDVGYYHGETVTRIGRNEFNIVGAWFTTCDKDTADYYFSSPMMKVFPDNKAVARPVYLFVEGTPVFYFPYMVFPIRRGRQSGFTLPTFGVSGRDGRYLRDIGYYQAFDDYADLYLSTDIMEKTRFAIKLTERHRIRYICNGRFRTEWRREFQSQRDRWMMEGSHLQDFADGTTVRVQGEFVSDRSYLEETQQSPEDRMTSELRSWLSANRSFGRASVQIALDRTTFLDTNPDTLPDELEYTQDLPDVRISMPSAPLFHVPSDPSERKLWHLLYWNLSAHYLARDEKSEDARSVNSAMRLNSEVTSSGRIWGVLSLSPRLKVSGTVYDRDRYGESFPGWLHGSTSITTSTDIYGIFPASLFGLSAFRHTITPSVTWSWAPDRYFDFHEGITSSDQADSIFYSFSDFSLPSSRNALIFSLRNGLEAKKFERGSVTRIDLASMSFSTSLDLEADEEPFSPLLGSLEIRPSSYFSVRADGSWDMYDNRLTGMSVTSSAQISGFDPTFVPDSGVVFPFQLPWRIGLSHNYRLGLDGAEDMSKFRITATISFTPRWEISYNSYFDAIDNSFINHNYTIRRDLDSWEAVFVRHVSDTDSGFYFRINIKDLPDIKVEQHVSNF
jgi:hypothetical protein